MFSSFDGSGQEPRYDWPWQEIQLRWFAPEEFNHPELMDKDFLLAVDEVRDRYRKPLMVNNDARTPEEHRQIYHPSEPPVSAHPEGKAIDFSLSNMHGHDRVRLIHVITKLHYEGHLPFLGLEIATAHIHLENFDNPNFDRPTVWAGVSK